MDTISHTTTTLPALAERTRLHDGEAGFEARPGAVRWRIRRGWTVKRQAAVAEHVADGIPAEHAAPMAGDRAPARSCVRGLVREGGNDRVSVTLV